MESYLATQEIDLEHLADISLYKEEKPYYLAQVPGYGTGEASNLQYSIFRGIKLYDVRGHEDKFRCDTHSFEFKHLPSRVKYQSDKEAVEYMRETVDFVKSYFSADRVICYDIRRRLNLPMTKEQKSSNDRSLPAPAVTAIHIDHTKSGGFHRIKRHLTPEEEVMYLSGDYRARIINVWRPLFRSISDAPLAFCDTRTLLEKDLIEADRVSPEYAGEIYYVRPTHEQRWYWLSNQSPDEVAVFLSFDSLCTAPKQPINYCAHGSFENPAAPKDAPPRESVEARFIVFTRV